MNFTESQTETGSYYSEAFDTSAPGSSSSLNLTLNFTVQDNSSLETSRQKTVIYSNVPPKIEVTSPKSSDLQTGNKITLSGNVSTSEIGVSVKSVYYAVVNNAGYSYYLYPSSKVSGSGVLLHPIITDEIKTDWAYWSLIIVDETEEEIRRVILENR